MPKALEVKPSGPPPQDPYTQLVLPLVVVLLLTVSEFTCLAKSYSVSGLTWAPRVRSTCQNQLRLSILVLYRYMALRSRVFSMLGILPEWFWVLLLTSHSLEPQWRGLSACLHSSTRPASPGSGAQSCQSRPVGQVTGDTSPVTLQTRHFGLKSMWTDFLQDRDGDNAPNTS